jgi:drug/metabolite transporter (DMT)-like permease
MLKNPVTFQKEISLTTANFNVSGTFLASVARKKLIAGPFWVCLAIPLADSLENLDRFTFFGKGINQYVILILALASLLVSLYALYICVRTRVGPSRWLWASVVVVGVGQLSVNWTTGRLLSQPFAFMSRALARKRFPMDLGLSDCHFLSMPRFFSTKYGRRK